MPIPLEINQDGYAHETFISEDEEQREKAMYREVHVSSENENGKHQRLPSRKKCDLTAS